jgi:hypothetical protein
MLRVADCVADCVWPVVPQPTEWERIGNKIDTATIFARADFVNVDRRWTFNHFFIAVWSAKDAHSANYENIT